MHCRRYFQVSIRTLLILTTLVAIGLAFWTRIYQRVREQKIVTARILDLGGKTTTRQITQVSPSLQKLVGESYFQEVVSVDLDQSLVTDIDLGRIGKLPGIKSLSIGGAYPRTCGLEPRLAHNPKHLPSQITSDGIRRLGLQASMEIARLGRTPIGDEALPTIASWSQLELLDLQKTKITSKGIHSIGNLEKLKKLWLEGTQVDDDAVPTLCKMGSLQELNLENTAVSGEGLLRLREELPSCQLQAPFLDLSAGIDPDPESMRWKEITRPMWFLSRTGELKLLILAGTAATDLHLSDLDRLENVDVIDLRHTKVTDAGVATIQRSLPKCKIVH